MSHARSILIIDDNDSIRDALTETLRDEGFAVQGAENGKEGLDWLRHREQMPDLILLDLTMPVMDGKTFLGVRRGDPLLAGVPVVVVTASGDRDVARWDDVASYVTKPIELPRLLAAIDACTSPR
jgi:CheY-like chemotaxis protein